MATKRKPELLALFSTAVTTAADGKVTGFTGVAYSGDLVPNFGWHGDIAIDLATLSLPPREVPVYLNHNPDKIVGRAMLVNDGNSLRVVDGRFSNVTECGKEVSALMGEGQPWQLSVGINGKFVSQDRAKPVKVNGRTLTVDGVFRNSRIVEFSFVGSGADPNAYAAQLSARLGISPPPAGAQHMDELERANARITELEAQVATLTAASATLTTERDTARTSLTALTVAQRNARITALFGEKHGMEETEIAELRTMTDAQFALVEKREKAQQATSGNGGALFTQQATAGRNEAGGAPPVTFNAPVGYGVEPERALLHSKALAYQSANKGTDYLTAVNAVSAV